MKEYWGSEYIAPNIIDICTRWRWVVSFKHRQVYLQGKSLWYPLDRRLGGPQCRSGRGGEEKNSWSLPGLEPLIIQPVAQRYTTELYRLVYFRNLFKIPIREAYNMMSSYLLVELNFVFMLAL
jgi:hypothetical protein